MRGDSGDTEILVKSINVKTGDRVRWKRREDGNWSFSFLTAHGRRTVNTKTKDKHLAVEACKRARTNERVMMRTERAVIAAFISPHKTTFAQALEEWVENLSQKRSPNTVHDYTLVVKRWLTLRKLHDEPPSAGTEADVSAFINDHTEVKAATRRLRLSVLCMFFDWLAAKGYAMGNPARAVGSIDMRRLTHEQKEPKRKVPFTLEEIQKILAYCDDRIAYEHSQYEKVKTEGVKTGYDNLQRIDQLRFWKAAVVIGRQTGLRLSDVSKLEWASVSVSSLVVWTRKRDTRVELPMCEELRTAIYEFCPHPAAAQSPHVFPEQCIKPIDVLSSQFAYILKGAGITGKSFHCLRSTCAIDFKERLIAAGKSEVEAVEIVAKLLGHSNSTTTKDHYL